jgi:processive 1,2-diacylglycerol beta-glucosyltransferase
LLARHAKLRSQYDKHANRKFFKHLGAFNPDLIVATHFMGLDALGQEFAAKLACVITDFEAHALWISPHVDQYFVATERTQSSLVARGVYKNKILVTGIPIHPKFQAKISSKDARRKLALRDDLPAVLVLGGGFGMGPIAETMQQLDLYPGPLQILVVAGRNEKLRKSLAAKSWKQPVRFMGFVDNMQELLAASDMVVSKPGGLTSSEALAMGCPMLIFNPIPGQESANSDFLLENGAAVKVNRVQDIVPAITGVFSGSRLQQLKRNAKMLGQPQAARDICDALLSMPL